jgi:hypothetical protein
MSHFESALIFKTVIFICLTFTFVNKLLLIITILAHLFIDFYFKDDYEVSQ